MAEYQTKQRQVLLDFLSQNADETVSAKQIAAALGDDKISMSAVYRNLAALEDAGKIRRVTKPGSRNVFFQLIGGEHCAERIHLSCKKCGRMYHMDSDSTERLIQGISKTNQFAIDRSDTVLIGLCAACQRR